MRYLGELAFQVPDWLIDRNIVRRVEQEGTINRIRGAQTSVVNSLISAARLNRLIEYEVLAEAGADVYTLPEMLTDLRRGVWTELSGSNVRVNVYRRNLQRAYLDAVNRQLNPPPAPTGPAAEIAILIGGGAASANSDVRPALRGELMELDRAAQRALNRATDAMTRLHLQDVRFQIQKILNPERERR